MLEHFNVATEKEAQKAWGDNLTYRGIDIFDLLLNKGGLDRFEAAIKLRYDLQDTQENLLVYFRRHDLFASGWDTWGKYGQTGAAVVLFRIKDGGEIEIVQITDEDDMIYSRPDGYCLQVEREEKANPGNAVFIRLD